MRGSLLQLLLEHSNFLKVDLLQGNVATYLRCHGIFKYAFIANLPLRLSVKKFENRLTFGEVMGKSLVSCFLTHSVVYYQSGKFERKVQFVCQFL